MAQYLRPKLRGAPIFFTVALAERGSALLVEEVAILREAVRITRARRPFGIDAWVVLPDHMHAIWTLPMEDPNYSDRWGAIKARFSQMVRRKHGMVGCKPTLPAAAGGAPLSDLAGMRAARSASKRRKQDAGIWQRRFWEHHIRDAADHARHLRFCWGDPVKHGLVARAADWPYSSLRRDLRQGRGDPDATGADLPGCFGEVA